MKRIRRVLELTMPAIRRGGGLKNTLKKTIQIYQREGFNGIKHGLKIVAAAEHGVKQNALNAEFLGPVNFCADKRLDLRVLIIAELSIPQCTKYRVTQKQEMLRSLGIDCAVVNWTDANTCMRLLQTHSLAIFYRVPAFPLVLSVINESRRLKVTTHWEVDDLIFDKPLLAGSRALTTLDRDTFASLLEGADLYRKAMLACDYGIASTTGLARAMTDAGVSEVFVIENALDKQTLDTVGHLTAVPANDDDGIVRIIYGSGTDTHNVDFEEVSNALLYILDTFNNVRLRLIGSLDLSSDFSLYEAQIERFSFCSYEAYLAYMAECQINIAPLETTVFNDAKSNIKVIEAAILGIPSVCSPRSAFVEVITHGRNGFLCDNFKEWKQALAQLVRNDTLRKQMGDAARELVKERYSQVQIVSKQLPSLLNRFKRPERKRVLSVNVFYAPRSYGGATIVAEEVNEILNRSDEFDVHVFTTLSTDVADAYSIRRYEINGVNIFGIAVTESSNPQLQFDNPEILDAFGEVISAVKPDIVHFHCIQGIGVSAIDLCASLDIPYIVTLHDAWWLCGRQFMINRKGHYCHQQEIDLRICAKCVDDARLNIRRQKRLRNALQQATMLLAPSRFFANFYIKNKFPPEKVFVNKNGICKPLPYVKRRTNEPLVFGYVGGNTEIKGVHLVKQVFARLKQSDIKLVVVDNTLNLGYPSYGKYFWRNVPRVEVVPAYTQRTIDEYFARIDILLFPTQWKESFGLTVREAIARNVWVIATDAGGVVEDIRHGENGLIIPFNDRGQALEQAIIETIDYFNRFKVGDEIHFKADRITFFEDQAAELGRIYNDVLSEREKNTGANTACVVA